MLHTCPTDALSTTFAALADPTRRAILARLAVGRGLGQGALAAVRDEPARPSPSTSGCSSAPASITRGREAQWRPCRLEAAPLKEVAEWAERYRRFWDANYERLDDLPQQLKEKEEPAWPTAQ